MAFGATPLDSGNIPIGSVYVPGTGFKALQGGTLFTDASSNDSAPARMEIVGGSKATYAYSASAIDVHRRNRPGRSTRVSNQNGEGCSR